jgi:hypothetical protein
VHSLSGIKKFQNSELETSGESVAKSKAGMAEHKGYEEEAGGLKCGATGSFDI